MSLPSNYRRLAYIQSSGTQYIDSDFIPNQDTRVYAECVFAIASSTQALFGSRVSSSSRQFQFVSQGGYYRTDYNTTISSFSSTDYGTAKFYIDKDKNITDLNGDVSYTHTYAAFTCPGNMYIFATNNNGSVYGLATATLYKLKVWDNGTLVRDYIPCKTDTGDVGLWDSVNNRFYASATTTDLIAGPEVYGNDEHTLLLLHGEEMKDSSENRVALTTNGVTVSEAQSKFGGSSLYFNGSSNYLQVPCLLTGNTPFTIDFWAYPTAKKNNTAWSHGGTNVTAVTGGGLELFGDGTVIYYCNGFLIQNGSYATNTWQHIALVGDGGSVRLFVNGALVGTYSGGYNFANYAEIIGANASAFGAENFQGYIDEFRISNVARWAGTFVPNEKPYEKEISVPDAPSGFRVVSKTDTSLDLAWNAVEDALGYHLYKDGRFLVDLKETTYTDTVEPFSSYEYSVAAYNENGFSDAAVLSVSVLPENPTLYLITDRTQADVAARNAKGTYRAGDLNRVNMAMDYLKALLDQRGYLVNVSPKTGWTDNDVPYPALMEQYLHNLSEIHDRLVLFESTPKVPETIEKFNYTKANDIEQILLDVYALLVNMPAVYRHSGVTICGMGGLIL